MNRTRSGACIALAATLGACGGGGGGGGTLAPEPPQVSVADASVAEGQAGTAVLTFAVSLSAAATDPVTVSYATADGTATAGEDYTGASGTVTIPAGETGTSLAVTVQGDTTPEPDETLTVTLSAPVNATLGDAQATGTLTNDDAVAAGTAKGLWSGDTSTGRVLEWLVLDDGTFWTLYSSLTNPGRIAGLIQGTGTSDNGTFTSADVRDFSLEGLGINDGTLDGAYQEGMSFDGGVEYPAVSQTWTFNLDYEPAYDATPAVGALAGQYVGEIASLAGGVGSAGLTIAADGALTLMLNNCSATGTLTPRASGNAYQASLTFGPAPCPSPSQTLGGVLFVDSTGNNLYLTGLDTTRSGGILYRGCSAGGPVQPVPCP